MRRQEKIERPSTATDEEVQIKAMRLARKERKKMSLTDAPEETELADRIASVTEELSQEEKNARVLESRWRKLAAEAETFKAGHEKRKQALLAYTAFWKQLDKAEQYVEQCEESHSEAMRLFIEGPCAEAQQAFEAAAQKVDESIESLGKLKRKLATEDGLKGTCQEIRETLARKRNPILEALEKDSQTLQEMRASVLSARADLDAARAENRQRAQSKADLRGSAQALQHERRQHASSST